MKIEYHSLHWDNVNGEMLAAHKRVMQHFNIPMNYHNLDGANHGLWMEWVLKESKSDVVIFFEPDCIPLNKNFIDYVRYAGKNKTFVGIAQVSNHIPPKSHIYAAPGFYCISKEAYSLLGKPSFTETRRSDTAEEISYMAEEQGLKYRALMPTYFYKEPQEGLWPLSNLGYYGIGTVFDNTIFHLYQSRMAQNIELFVSVCDQVTEDLFDLSNFTPATTFKYEGNIVR
jgi:hypothetical protein